MRPGFWSGIPNSAAASYAVDVEGLSDRELQNSAFMYRITKQIEFCYGHRLLNYAGKCRHLHGHNGRAEVVLEGAQLDDRGMLVDFSDVKRNLARWIDDHLDHRMILHRDDPAVSILQELGEPLYLVDDNPTAENIARIIYEQATLLGMPVSEISLWETSSSCATYRPRVR